MMKKLSAFLIILTWLSLSTAITCNGSPADASQAGMVDLSPIETVIGSSDTAFHVDVLGTFQKALSGELDLSPSGLLNGLLKMLFAEIFENAALLRNLVILAIVSAVIKNLSDSFQNKSVSDIGFYISYMAMVATLFSSFKIAAGLLTGLVGSVTGFLEAGIPVFVSLIALNGNFSGAYVFNTLLVFACGFVSRLVSYIIAPAIISASALNIVNYLAENDILTNLAAMFKKTLTWLLRIIALGFVSIVSIQKISTPIVNNIAMKTAKSAVNAVPVVGGILSGAVDNVLYWAKAMRGGVLIVVVIALVSICLMPVVKLAALSFTYKLAAALIQPICDKRIVECIDAAGDYTALLLSSGAIVSLMFLVSVIIMLSF